MRRRGKEETLEDRWAMTVVKIMLLMQSLNWRKLLDIDREAAVCPGFTRGQSG